VSIELQGPVGEDAFRKLEKALNDAIKDLGKLTDPPSPPPGGVKLKVKKIKAETKPKP
jgi:hypothetical protein